MATDVGSDATKHEVGATRPSRVAPVLVLVAVLLTAVLVLAFAPIGQGTPVDQTYMEPGSLLPGHQPGLVYLGFSSPQDQYESEVARVGRPTVRRGIYTDVGSVSREVATMRESMDQGRLPWTSFSGDWADVASGRWDDTLRERFEAYRSLPAPALATFAHEPVGDGDPADFVAAWTRILDLADQVGTGYVSLVPIMNGYVWGTWGSWSDAQISQYLPDELLSRWSMVGVDVYHGATQSSPGESPAERLTEVLSWADRHDVPLLGIGEIGVHDATTWANAWSVVEAHSERFMAVSYFNSWRNLREGVAWYLTDEVLGAYQQSLASDSVARLPYPSRTG